VEEAVVVAVEELLLPLVVLQLKPRKRRRRRKKRFVSDCVVRTVVLNKIRLQEESDEDMGFGLFD
jgi:hypothetical protein